MDILFCLFWIFVVLVAIYVFAASLLGIYLLCSSFGRWAPPVRSSGRLKDAVLKDVSEYLTKVSDGHQIVDLGSGWGTLLIPLAKKFPNHNFVGIERAFTPFYVSCFRARKIPNLQFIREDFFKYNLSKTNVVLLFLIGFMMPKVTEKCQKELHKGARVYASRFALTGMKADKVIRLGNKMETYFIYDMK